MLLSSSVVLLRFHNPIINFLDLLLPLNVISNASIQFLDQILCCWARILHSRLLCILQVHLVVTQIKARHNVVEWIFWLRGQNQPVHALNDVFKLQCWWIVSVEHTVANTALRVHVAVVNWREESDFWSPEGVIAGEFCVQQKQSVFIWRVFRTQQQYFPVVKVSRWENRYKWMRLFCVILNLSHDSFHWVVVRNFFDRFFTFQLLHQLFSWCSWSFNFRNLELMNAVDLVKRPQLSLGNKLFDCEVLSAFFIASDSDTQNGFLFEQFQTFFKASCQVTFTTWSQSNVFQSVTSWADSKWVNDDIVFDEDSGCIHVTVGWRVVFAVCQSQNSQFAIWVFFAEWNQVVCSQNNRVVKFGWSSGLGSWN